MIHGDNKLSVVLISILYFILGIFFVAATDGLLKTFNYTLICLCAIIGVIQLINFFISKKYKNGHYADLIIAVVFIWVSLILYIFPGFNVLPIVFSLYLFIMGVDFLVQFLQKSELKGFNRWYYFILFIVSIIIGLLLIFHTGTFYDGDDIYIFFKITGIYLIVVSVMYIFNLVKSFKN